MLTLKQLERLWNAGDYPRMARQLLAGRVETTPRTLVEAAQRVPAAAWGLIRLDEFARPDHPLARRFLNTLVTSQNDDGGWGQPLSDAGVTALVLRALSTSSGEGPVIDRGLAFLRNLQRPDGGFSQLPVPRGLSDPGTTAAVWRHVRHIPAAARVLDVAALRQAVLSDCPTLSDRRRDPGPAGPGLDAALPAGKRSLTGKRVTPTATQALLDFARNN